MKKNMTCSICMCYNSIVNCFILTYTVNKYFTVIISCDLLLVLQSTCESSIDGLVWTLYIGYWLLSNCMATTGDKWNLIKFSMLPCSFSFLNGISLFCCQHVNWQFISGTTCAINACPCIYWDKQTGDCNAKMNHTSSYYLIW